MSASLILWMSLSASAAAPVALPADGGAVQLTPVGHGTLILQHAGRTIWVDPWAKLPLAGLPPADIVLITDVHQDHLDAPAVRSVLGPSGVVVAPAAVASALAESGGPPVNHTLANGESVDLSGVGVRAVAMYNHHRGPSEGVLFHDKGRGNGYVVSVGGLQVYVAGDTACTDEMRALTGIDVAFIPMNLPYTMPPSEAAECVAAFAPKVVIPYHYRGSDLAEFSAPLADRSDIQVRLLDWY